MEDAVRKRLDDHNENRITVQSNTEKICECLLEEIDSLENKIGAEIEQAFEREDTRHQEAIRNEGNNKPANDNAVYSTQKYSVIVNTGKGVEIKDKITLKIERVEYNKTTDKDSIAMLKDLSEQHHSDKVKAKEALFNACNEFREEVRVLDLQINSDLEEKFTAEDKRLQSLLHGELDKETLEHKLFLEPIYCLDENKETKSIKDMYKLLVMYNIPGFNKRKIKGISIKEFKNTKIYLSIEQPFSPEEEESLNDLGIMKEIKISALVWEKNDEKSKSEYIIDTDDNSIKIGLLKPDTTYCMEVTMKYNEQRSDSSNIIEFRPDFSACCAWGDCPEYSRCRYQLDNENPRIATKIETNGEYCSVVGNIPLPPNKTTSWQVVIPSWSMARGESFNMVGVTQFGERLHNGLPGWYFSCDRSALYSGLPHRYVFKEYIIDKRNHSTNLGDRVGVIMDTAKGNLSFISKNVNFGIGFEGIPLDKPLVPCAIITKYHSSIEIDPSEAKENLSRDTTTPYNITIQNTTWDSITIKWDGDNDASFYQIEVDGNGCWGTSLTNTFTKRGFLPVTEHSFRVRTVKRGSVSEWSDVMKGKTVEAPKFPECSWSKCIADHKGNIDYSINDKTPMIAKKVGECGYGEVCTIVGNVPLPPNTVTSWYVKVLISKKNDGEDIYIGVALSDIGQASRFRYDRYEWYMHCYNLTLSSGPPHEYWDKEYGPREKKDGEYVHNRDSIGVIMDTKKGELSFVLNGVNLGVAFEGIPLDRPLVPCVSLKHPDDSVELNLSEVSFSRTEKSSKEKGPKEKKGSKEKGSKEKCTIS